MEGRVGRKNGKMCASNLPKHPWSTSSHWGKLCVCVLTCAMVGGECALMMALGGGEMLGGGGGLRKGCVRGNPENFFFFFPLGVAALLSRTTECCPPAA